MTELTLSVPDISCAHCKTSIEGAVAGIAGVKGVEVNIDDRTVDVAYDDALPLETIVEAIEEQGYAVAH